MKDNTNIIIILITIIMITITIILASMIKVGGWWDGWTLLYTAYFLNIAVMSEKSHRLIFLEGKRVAVVERKRRELLEELFEVGMCVYMFICLWV
jgi:hypothetical protein